MAIRRVQAIIECDGCNKSFTVDLDPADSDLKSYLDLAAYVDDHTDIVGEHALCHICWGFVARKLENADDPTYEQVHAALRSDELEPA